MARKYAKMDGCPVKGCQDPLIITTGYKPTVVGVKRHVRHWHPDEYDKITWPDIHTVPSGRKVAAAIRGTSKPRSTLSERSVEDLRKKARRQGIDPKGMRKSQLVEALS
jgi:hypothetical protein